MDQQKLLSFLQKGDEDRSEGKEDSGKRGKSNSMQNMWWVHLKLQRFGFQSHQTAGNSGANLGAQKGTQEPGKLSTRPALGPLKHLPECQ